MPLNKINKTSVVFTALLIIVLNLGAWSVSDYYLGNLTPSFSARNLGMGNTGVYDTFSPMSIYLNPANLTIMEGRVGLTADGLFTRNEDNRSFPLYNSFDTFIDDATYSSNITMYDDYGLGGYYKHNLGKGFLTGLGITYLPAVNFKGTYDEEVRNNRNSDNDGYPEIIAINKIKNTGKLNALGVTTGGGYVFDNGMQFHLGATLNSMGGSSEYKKSIKWTEWSMLQSIASAYTRRNVLPDSIYTSKSDYSGMQVRIGTDIKLDKRWGLGISYSLKSELDRDTHNKSFYGPDTTLAIPTTSTNLLPQITETDVKDKYIMPARMRVGLNYQPRNIMQTYFNAEIEYVSWSQVGKGFRDSWDLHMGVEHSVTNRIPLRLGFQSATEWAATPDYENLDEDGKPAIYATKVFTPSITAGSSVQIRKNLVLDIGLSFSWREYQALDMFRDGYYNDKLYNRQTNGLPATYYLLWPNSYIMPTDRGWENADKVRESFTNLSAGLTWTW